MKPCKHRYIKGYDDGDGRWDWNCLECGEWPEREEAHPAAVSGWHVREHEWKHAFIENLKEMREDGLWHVLRYVATEGYGDSLK